MHARLSVYQRSFVKLALASALGFSLAASALNTHAADIDAIHFLIPGGAGGGWDGTARGTGEALTKSGLIKNASFENLSGGGGGKALAWMIKTQPENTIMVQSTPIVLRSISRHEGYVSSDAKVFSISAADSPRTNM